MSFNIFISCTSGNVDSVRKSLTTHFFKHQVADLVGEYLTSTEMLGAGRDMIVLLVGHGFVGGETKQGRSLARSNWRERYIRGNAGRQRFGSIMYTKRKKTWGAPVGIPGREAYAGSDSGSADHLVDCLKIVELLACDSKLSRRSGLLNECFIDTVGQPIAETPFMAADSDGRVMFHSLAFDNREPLMPFQQKAMAVWVFGNLLWECLPGDTKQTYLKLLGKRQSRFGEVKRDFVTMVSSWYYDMKAGFDEHEDDRLRFVTHLCSNSESSLKKRFHLESFSG